MVLILIKNHGYIYRNTGCGVSRSGIQTQNTFTEMMAGITNLGTSNYSKSTNIEKLPRISSQDMFFRPDVFY